MGWVVTCVIARVAMSTANSDPGVPRTRMGEGAAGL